MELDVLSEREANSRRPKGLVSPSGSSRSRQSRRTRLSKAQLSAAASPISAASDPPGPPNNPATAAWNWLESEVSCLRLPVRLPGTCKPEKWMVHVQTRPSDRA